MIAHLSKAAVVPALIIGSNKALPVSAKWLKRARISIAFDSPIYSSTKYGEGNDLYENITQRIMCAIGELKKRYEDNSG
jgi:1-acyl-sn-glycerol-3-phosphate acyltransferase